MSSVFAFRLSFSLAARSNLPFDSDRFLLSGDPVMVELSSAAPTLKQARQAALLGHRYPTEAAAWIARREWGGHLARAFAEHGIGADLGTDAEAVLMPVPVPAALIDEQGPTTWYKDVPELNAAACK